MNDEQTVKIFAFICFLGSSGTFLFGEEHGNVELLIFESNTSLPLRKLKSKVTLHQTIILRGLLKAEIFNQETSKLYIIIDF